MPSNTEVVGAPYDRDGIHFVEVTRSVYPSTHQYMHHPTFSGRKLFWTLQRFQQSGASADWAGVGSLRTQSRLQYGMQVVLMEPGRKLRVAWKMVQSQPTMQGMSMDWKGGLPSMVSSQIRGSGTDDCAAAERNSKDNAERVRGRRRMAGLEGEDDLSR
jgi:hypothetical protein